MQDFSVNSTTILQKPFLVKAAMTNDKVVYTYKNSDQPGSPTLVGFVDLKNGQSYDFPKEYSVSIEIYVDEISNQIIVQGIDRIYEVLDFNSKTSYQLFEDLDSEKNYFLQEYLDNNTLVFNSGFGNTYLYDIPSKTKTFIGKFGRILNYNSYTKQLCFLRDDSDNPISLHTIGLDSVDIKSPFQNNIILAANALCDKFFVQGVANENPERFLVKDNQKTPLMIISKKDSLSAYSIISDRGYFAIAQLEYSALTKKYGPSIYIYDSNKLTNQIKISNSSNLIMF